jgi:hypothetical protein
VINPLARKAVLAPYVLLRTPLGLIDSRLAARYLPDDSRVRTTIARGLGSLDATAARLLGTVAPPDGTADDGAAKVTVTPPAPAEPATASPAQAEPPVGDAGADPSDVAAPGRPEVPAEEVEQVAEELLAEREEVPHAGELGEVDDEEKLRQAELRAKHIVEEYEQEQQAKRARSE